MTSLPELKLAARRVAALLIIDERLAPVFDRLQEEIEAAKRGSPRERARRYLLETTDA